MTAVAEAHAEVPAAGARRLRSRALALLGPLALYGALSLLFWFTPIADAPRGQLISNDDIDASAYMWMLAWWPHALLEGLDPFVTDAVFAPEGYNLTWATPVPGPALLMAPITLLVGPEATWNALALLAPALSAWTAYLLCRHLTGRVAPSLVGGYVFGFSPFMLAHLGSQPNIALAALLPVAVLMVVRHVDGSLSSRGFALAMTAVLTGQFLTSTEMLATGTLLGAVLLLAAYALYRDRRAVLRRTAILLAGAYVATGVLVGPYLYGFLFEPHADPKQALLAFPADALAWVVPWRGQALAAGHTLASVPSYTNYNYLGAPLIVLMLLFAWRYRRTRAARLAMVAVVVAAVASLGRELRFGGESTGIDLPWALAAKVPPFEYAMPIRLAVFVILPAAVIVALWLSWSRGWAPWALALAVIATLIPDIGSPLWRTPITHPPLFEQRGVMSLLEPDDTVLVVPPWRESMRWQARERFPFKLAGGYLGAFPESYRRYPIYGTLLAGRPKAGSPAELRRFVRDKGVTAIVVDERYFQSARALFATLGTKPVDRGGILVYRLPRRSDSAPTPVR